MTGVEYERLAGLGLELPPLRAKAGNYVGWVRCGDLLFLSGQGADGYTGRVGASMTRDDAYLAARSSGLNLLAQIEDAAGGLGAVRQVVQVRGYVACTEEFTEIPQVVNGASDLFLAVFGERGPHARTAIGVLNLPLGFAVEVDMAVQLG